VTEVLIFELQEHRYAVPASVVAEVVRAVALVPVAGTPRAVEGVFNLRGTVVPVVDVRARFGVPRVPLDPSQHFAIVRIGARRVALRVDRVETLVTIDTSRIAPAQASLPSAQHVAGVATLDDGLVVIYDVDAFLSQTEAEELAPTLDAMTIDAATSVETIAPHGRML
jgi:purine-binding chemotaxis protein CheW